MNLFFMEALHVLLSVSVPGVGLTRRLVPATDFLHHHLVTLQRALYKPCYLRVVKKLWQLIVKVILANLCQIRWTESYAVVVVAAIVVTLVLNGKPLPPPDSLARPWH